MITGVLDWAMECRTLPGQTVCGDRCLVREVADGVLVAVIDGIGHGEEASLAAQRAIGTIEENLDHTFSSLLQKCHQNLLGTRGAVMSLAFLDHQRTMTWTGVGNVEGRLFRRRVKYAERCESLLLRTGVVGRDGESLPTFYPRGVSVIRGDLLVLATDGIRSDFEGELDVAAHPQQIAHDLITHHSRSNDDALVLVGKYIG